MRPTQEPTAELIEKYYYVLIKLQKELAVNPYLRTSTFAKDNKIGIVFISVIKKCGIIKGLGTVKRDPNHVWNTIDPTRQMAVKVIKTMNLQLREDKKRRLKEKKEIEEREIALAEDVLIEQQTLITQDTLAEIKEAAIVSVKNKEAKEIEVTKEIEEVKEIEVTKEFEEVKEVEEIVAQTKHLPALIENHHVIEDAAPKEHSFAFYLFGIPIFKIKKVN